LCKTVDLIYESTAKNWLSDIGLLRQFFPKGTDLRRVTWKEVKYAVENLNNRLRKTRDYLTPNQLFNDKFVPLI